MEDSSQTPTPSASAEISKLLPYSGSPLANPLNKEHIPNSTSLICNHDRSGKVKYRYNNLGFRGEDYDVNAKFHIYVCGPSEAFGLGLNEEDTWWHHFRLRFAHSKGVKPSEVNVLNFSQIGASMDYIARVIVSQCRRIQPDLVLVALSPSSRTEYFTDESERYFSGRAVTFNPSMYNLLQHHDENEFFQQRTASLNEDDHEELLTAVEGFYNYYTERTGLINRLKNILLIQQFCSAQNIPSLIWTLHRFNLQKELNLALPQSIQALAECVDFSKIYTHGILHPNHQKAADGIHPGPDVNLGVAQHLWDFYLKMQK
jgi:hypothetical protein